VFLKRAQEITERFPVLFLFFKNLETKQVKRSIRELGIDEVRRDGLKRVVIAKHTQEFSSSSLNRNFLTREQHVTNQSREALREKGCRVIGSSD